MMTIYWQSAINYTIGLEMLSKLQLRVVEFYRLVWRKTWYNFFGIYFFSRLIWRSMTITNWRRPNATSVSVITKLKMVNVTKNATHKPVISTVANVRWVLFRGVTAQRKLTAKRCLWMESAMKNVTTFNVTSMVVTARNDFYLASKSFESIFPRSGV